MAWGNNDAFTLEMKLEIFITDSEELLEQV